MVSVVTGFHHSCALLKDGLVKCWGENGSGQLGYGDTSNRGDAAGELGDNLPAVDLGTGRKAKAITVGGLHTCALLDNNSVKCWGINREGELGYGDTASRGDAAGEMGDNLPAVDLGTGRKAKAITGGDGHTCALLNNNTVKCWGRNYHGQLGYGDTNYRGNEPDEMGNNLPAVDLGTGRKAKAITAGIDHTCAILDNNTVKCWGINGDGELGYGDTSNRGDAAGEMGNNLPAVNLGTGRKAKAITGGDGHTCAVLDNKAVKCWGANDAGQLGLGDTNNRGDAAGEMSNNLPAVNLGTGRKAKAITAGDRHTCALLDNKAVKCWGINNSGRLGYGDTTTRGDEPGEMGDNLPAVDLGTGRTTKAVDAGSYQTCALLDNSSVKCWGKNESGQLGYGDTNNRGDESDEMGDNLPTVNLGVRVRVINGGGAYTCAILEDGTVKCWGGNYAGQLGYGDTNNRGDAAGEMGDNLPAVDLGTGRTTKVLAVGYAHACAILDNGSLKCWGQNQVGQLGLGDRNDRGDASGEMGDNLPAVDLGTGRKAKAVAAAGSHTCAILDNGAVKCWGFNNSGQLGYGDTAVRGDDAGEMGDNLPAVNLGTRRKAKAIAAGYSHTCAILDNNAVKCWGQNDSGQLGYGDTNSRGDAPGEMGNNLPAVNLGTRRKAKTVSLGDSHTCAILDNGALKCWGYNSGGQLGYGDTTSRGDGPNEMGNNLPAIDLGTGRKAKVVAPSEEHTCAFLDNSTVKCWGSSSSGQLGYGDTTTRGDGPNETGNNLPAIDLGTGLKLKTIDAGWGQTCALLSDSTVKCWGANYSGQLGYGDTNHRGDAAGEMGDNLHQVVLTG